ncbi:MAG: hypothetical protein U9N04_04105 [Patescibacteria group bacterium]|nr:hypothetical protein [Patescibacteria group bacterium]
MKKLFIVITLIIFIVIGIVSVFYVTGNFDKIINKILHRSEVLDMSDEKNFDEILRRVKDNLDEVESVRAEVKGSDGGKIGDYDSDIEEGEGKINFVFPDKKLISTVDLPFSLRLRENFAGGAYEGKTIVLGNDIYIEFPWIAHALKEEKEKNKDFPVDKFPFASGWLHGVDGQSMPLPVPDTSGDNLNFDLSVYPKGWDFTRNLEKIEEYLGIEEINGVKCHRYKVKIEKISPYNHENLNRYQKYFLEYVLGLSPDKGYLPPDSHLPPDFKGKIILEQIGNNIKCASDNKEILIPLSEKLIIPVMYKSVDWMGWKDDPSSWCYKLSTWAIEGEIWIGAENSLVYKENYTTEISSSIYYPDESKEENKLSWEPEIFKYNTEITYSNFDSDIKIEAPAESITVNDYLKQIGYPTTEEEISKAQVKARDERRKSNLRSLPLTLNVYYSDYAQYPVSVNLEKVNNESSNFYKALVPDYLSETQVDWFLFDPLDPEFYYTYKSDGFVYSLTARLENLEDEDCVIENGICLYTLKGGNPAPDYEKIREIKDRCKGFLEIMDEKCVDGKLEMKVKVSTAGDCFVVSFIANYADNKKKIAEFSSLGDDVYLVVLNNCDKIEKLIVSGEGGFTIGN